MKFRRAERNIELDDFPDWIVNGVTLKKHSKKRKKRSAMVRQFRKNGNDSTGLTTMKRTYGLKCDMCGKDDKLTVHHKIEVSDGGTNHPDNITILCSNCHMCIHNRRFFRGL